MTFSSNARIDQIILPATRDLGGFPVKRALPSALRRTVGPFIFLDSFGPVTFGPGAGIDSRPRPLSHRRTAYRARRLRDRRNHRGRRAGRAVHGGPVDRLQARFGNRPQAIGPARLMVLGGKPLATAVSFHNDLADLNQFIHFFKNVAISGGLLHVIAFTSCQTHS